MTMLSCDGCGGDLRCVCPPKAMADAQTPVLTNEQILVLASAHTCSVSHPTRYVLDTLPFARAILAAKAPAQPDRAMMQQALETIIALNVQYAIDRYGDASQAESMDCVRVARKALDIR